MVLQHSYRKMRLPHCRVEMKFDMGLLLSSDFLFICFRFLVLVIFCRERRGCLCFSESREVFFAYDKDLGVYRD